MLAMFKPLSIFVGLRYTGSKRRNHFISFISLVSMLGVILGVAVLILVLSVMNGFDRELRERILGMVPHAVLKGSSGLDHWEDLMLEAEEHEGVVSAAPFVSTQGMFTYRGSVRGALVQGIDPKHEGKVSIVNQHLEGTQLTDLVPGQYRVILGNLLARSLGVGVGDKVTFILPEASITPAGVLPRLKRFTVVGTFSVGAELDASLAYINIADAARLSRLGDQVEGLRLKTTDLFQAPAIAEQLKAKLPADLYTSDWTRTHGNLFQAIKMEKFMVGLMLFIIVAVAAFNIISTLVMVVTDKQADIAIMRTLGASPNTIMKVFIVQGAVVGVFGTLLGAVLGVILAVSVTDIVKGLEALFGFEVLDSDIYFISEFPSHLLWSDVFTICSITLLMSLLATLYPALRAANIKPAEALRYEA